jgi:mannose-6-phosphate isomerase-like protein (cupin superfamily)
MMTGLLIENLPDNKEVDGAKRWEEDKGEFVQIAYDEEMRHLAYFEIREGFWRGKHYHEEKDETFYVVSGVIRAVFINQDRTEREEHLLRKGERIRVKPRIWHVFYGLEDATVVEYSPQKYDKNDAYKGDFEG